MKPPSSKPPTATTPVPTDAPKTRWAPLAPDPSQPTATSAYTKTRAFRLSRSSEPDDWLKVLMALERQAMH